MKHLWTLFRCFDARYKPVIDPSFWVACLVLVSAVDADVTVAIAVDVHNLMK